MRIHLLVPVAKVAIAGTKPTTTRKSPKEKENIVLFLPALPKDRRTKRISESRNISFTCRLTSANTAGSGWDVSLATALMPEETSEGRLSARLELLSKKVLSALLKRTASSPEESLPELAVYLVYMSV